MITPILLSVLSGIFYVLSFAPWNLSLLQWIAFVPLFIAVQRLELHSTQKQTDSKKTLLRKIALLGFIVSFIIALGGFYWIAYAVEHYGEVPFYFSVGILLLFCITGQLQVPLYLLLRHLAQEKFFRVKTLGWPFLGGLLYVGIEATYPKLFSDTAGNAFFKSPWTRQMVEWGGPFFLTCCSLWINEWVFAAYQARKLKIALVPLALFAFIQGYGAWRTHNLTQAIHAAEKGPLLNVAIIQANIGDFLKVAAERGSTTASHEVMDRYIGLSHQSISASPAPDLIVWPETAYPSLFEKSHSAQDLEMEFKIKQFAKEFRGTLAFGGYDEDLEHVDYNSMFFYRDPEADPFHLGTRIYHKAILLQFGETLPGVDQFPEMKSWFPNMGFLDEALDRNCSPFTMLRAPSSRSLLRFATKGYFRRMQQKALP